jgi:uncharacterized membrane protein YbhN (UPF0104 family)
MRKRLTHIAPLQLGVVQAIFYALLSLLFIPFFLLAILLAPHPQNQSALPAIGMVLGTAIVFPIVYAIIGFIFGIVAALIYNVIATWTGGIEFTLEDAPVRIGFFDLKKVEGRSQSSEDPY